MHCVGDNLIGGYLDSKLELLYQYMCMSCGLPNIYKLLDEPSKHRPIVAVCLSLAVVLPQYDVLST